MLLATVMLTDAQDGTLGWVLLGCLITFLLSRRKGRTLLVSMAWTLLSGGAAYFLGSIGTSTIEKIAGAKIAKGAGEFFISAFGASWIPPVLKMITKKAEGLNE